MKEIRERPISEFRILFRSKALTRQEDIRRNTKAISWSRRNTSRCLLTLKKASRFKFKHRVMLQEVYCLVALLMGRGAVERHLEMAQPTKKAHSQQSADYAVDCVNAEIGIFLFLCVNATVCCMPQH